MTTTGYSGNLNGIHDDYLRRTKSRRYFQVSGEGILSRESRMVCFHLDSGRILSVAGFAAEVVRCGLET
jgi:hypothetical protein